MPIIRDWRKLPVKELTRAERTMKFSETHLIVPDGEMAGKPLILADFQESFLYSVYDNPHGTRKAVLSMAKKNAKTSTTACILLSSIAGPEAKLNSQIVSGAMSREQAALIFKLASKMIRNSDKLNKAINIIPSQKMLNGLVLDTEFKSLASDGSTAHGISARVGLIDECGQVVGPISEFIEAISTSQGAHADPLMVYLSTQAPTDNDFFSQIIDRAIESQDPHTVVHLYEAPADCDLMDKEAWKMANPAMGLFRSEKDLEEKMKEALQMPSLENSARNLFLNQRVQAESPFVSKLVWEENGTVPSSMKGKKVFGGLDLSSVSDLTALVFVDEEGNVVCYFWLPKEGLVEKSRNDKVAYDVWAKEGILSTTPGRAIEYEYIAKVLKNIFDEYDVQHLNFDRAHMKFLTPYLKKEGFTDKQLEKLVEFGQGFVSMGGALRELEAKLLQKKLKHGMNPVLTMCAGNCKVEMDPAGNRKFTKKKSNGRIDGMVSLAMAVDALAKYEREKVKEYKVIFV